MAPDGVRTEKVNLTIPALGVLTGSGTISPGGALNYQMTANLNGAVATAITKLVGLGDKGESIPFFIRGTTSNPSFVPDVKGMLTGQIGSQIGSALKSKLQGKSASKVHAEEVTQKARNRRRTKNLGHEKAYWMVSQKQERPEFEEIIWPSEVIEFGPAVTADAARISAFVSLTLRSQVPSRRQL